MKADRQNSGTTFLEFNGTDYSGPIHSSVQFTQTERNPKRMCGRKMKSVVIFLHSAHFPCKSLF